MLALIASFNPQRANSGAVASGHWKAPGRFRGPAEISLCGRSLSVLISLWRWRWAASVHWVKRTEAGPGSMQHRTGHLAEAIQVTLYWCVRDTPSPKDTLNSPSSFPTPAPTPSQFTACPTLCITGGGPSVTLGYVTAHIRQWEGGLPRRLVTGESPLHQVLRCKQKGRDLLTFSSGSNG